MLWAKVRLLLAVSEVYSNMNATAHKERKQSRQQSALTRVPPSESEAKALHDLYLKHGEGRRSGDAGSDQKRVWMEDTKKESILIMYPQDRKCALPASLPQ